VRHPFEGPAVQTAPALPQGDSSVSVSPKRVLDLQSMSIYHSLMALTCISEDSWSLPAGTAVQTLQSKPLHMKHGLLCRVVLSLSKSSCLAGN